MVLVIVDIIYNYAQFFIFEDVFQELLKKNIIKHKLPIQTFRKTRYTITCNDCQEITIVRNSYDLYPNVFYTEYCFYCESDHNTLLNWLLFNSYPHINGNNL